MDGGWRGGGAMNPRWWTSSGGATSSQHPVGQRWWTDGRAAEHRLAVKWAAALAVPWVGHRAFEQPEQSTQP
ncbi:hypothetical protein GUJ93_ZPchr0011g28121 [Zizania palustris]|uniref:Uncharacterized protein n=1 Tax=Zizania palustris TaxID=103762 RepID=A0A8J6BKU3_ZIZPA|nr:hypothetical protein GUJ93_ZPchr0011g28121 [Zizania palustris]